VDYDLYPKRGRKEKGKERNGKNKKLGNSAKCSQNFSTVSAWLFLQVCATVALADNTSTLCRISCLPGRPLQQQGGLKLAKTLMKPLDSTGILQIKISIHL